MEEAVAIWTPSDVLNITKERLATPGKVIVIEGVYEKKGSRAYGDKYYDRLRSQYENMSISVIMPVILREKINDGDLVQLSGTIGKKINSSFAIELQLNVSGCVQVANDFIDEKEQALLKIQQRKADSGFKNVDNILSDLLYKGERPLVALLFAETSITDQDFNAGVQAASGSIDFIRETVSFFNVQSFVKKLLELDNEGFAAIAVVRGGGAGIDIFDNTELAECMISLETPLISAVGHPGEKPFISKIADKDCKTPSLLGTYFKDLTEEVAATRNNSRAALVKEVEGQFKKQLDEANQKNKELQQKLESLNKAQENVQEEIKKTVAKMQEANAGLQSSLDELNKQHTQSAKELSSAKTLNEQLQKRLENMSANDDAKSKQIDGLQKTVAGLNGTLNSLNQQITLTANELQQAKDKSAYIYKLLEETKKKRKSAVLVAIGAILILVATIIISVL